MSTSIRLIAPPCPPFFMAHAFRPQRAWYSGCHASRRSVPRHITDLVFGSFEPTGDLLDLVRQEHRHPHVLQIVAERMHVGQQVIAAQELPIPGEAVNDYD